MNKLFFFKNHFKNQKVFITGHNGFKGTWLCLIFTFLGAKVIGCGLRKSNEFSFYRIVSKVVYKNIYLDLCNFENLKKIVFEENPKYIIHLAAQALVFDSYLRPYYTFKNNLISSLNLMEVLRVYNKNIYIVFITSDKVYKNIEKLSGYSENSLLGGDDPYSGSKASIELMINSYIKTYFKKSNKVKIAVARAGNVIGGGDWSKNRIIPDIIDSYFNKKKITIRSPRSERPWQHVLEPLFGYISILIALKKNNIKNGEIFNFGPSKKNTVTVNEILNILSHNLKKLNGFDLKFIMKKSFIKETLILRLDSKKAYKKLNWKCKLNIFESLKLTSDWYSCFYNRKKDKEVINISINQIKYYLSK